MKNVLLVGLDLFSVSVSVLMNFFFGGCGLFVFSGDVVSCI